MNLRDRVALVTGGGTGLGRAISHELAGHGTHLVVVYSRSETEATATVRELRERGVQAEALRADVADSAAVGRVVEQTLERFGRLDVLINDAATTKFAPFSDLDAVEEADWDRILAVNTKGPWLLAKAAARALRAQQGAIVNIASIAGVRPSGSSIPYAVSKAALIHLTSCLAVALAPDVRVNCVAPGWFITRWSAGFSPEQKAAYESRIPLKRAATLDDLARVAVELAANDSMTGETIVMDGGLTKVM